MNLAANLSHPRLRERLAEGLLEADREAARVTAHPDAAQAEPRLALDSEPILARFLNDLGETLGQIFIAGLAFPDPELTDELLELAGRAARLALATAVRHCLRLRTLLDVLAQERDATARAQLAPAIWDETQQLLTWYRVLRVEHDLGTVQLQLEKQPRPTETSTPTDLDTVSLALWPLGLELGLGGRAVIHARALDDAQPVILLDELTEIDSLDPLHQRAISRLFQVDLRLDDLMRSVIVVDNHPVVERDGTLVLRPAFSSRPSLRAVASNFVAPKPPHLLSSQSSNAQTLTRSGHGAVPGTAPSTLPARLHRRARAATLTPIHLPLSLHTTPILDFNLTKLLIREATPSLHLELTVLAPQEPLQLLAVHTDLDGRTLPHLDPTAYTLHSAVLAQRALQDPTPEDTLEGLALRTAALLFGAATEHHRARIHLAASQLAPSRLTAMLRTTFLQRLLGQHTPDPDLEPLLRDALALATRQPTTTPQSELLTQLDDSDDANPHLGIPLLFAITWLAHEHNLSSQLEPLLRNLLDTRFSTADHDPTPLEICTHALLIALTDDEPDTHTPDEPLEQDDAEELEEHTGVLHTHRALPFFEAHLAHLTQRWRKRRSPLPRPFDLLFLGDTLALLSGHSRLGATLRPLDLPLDRLRNTCAGALLAWTLDTRNSPALRLEAADALLTVLAAGMRPWFVHDL